MLQVLHVAAARGARLLARPTAWPIACSHRRADRGACAYASAVGEPCCSMRPGASCAAPGRRLPIACAGCAMIRSAPMRSSPRSSMQHDPGLSQQLSFDPQQDIVAPLIARGARPRVAVLREQGVNSQVEMAAVLDRAGFEAHDVHMSDLLGGAAHARGFRRPGRVRRILLWRCARSGRRLGALDPVSRAYAPRVRSGFFARSDTFSLGVCNGCQMFALLKELIPGRAALAALPAQPQRAVRGPPQSGADRGLSRRCCWPGWRARACRSRSRTARAGRSSGPTQRSAALSRAAAGGVSLHQQPR